MKLPLPSAIACLACALGCSSAPDDGGGQPRLSQGGAAGTSGSAAGGTQPSLGPGGGSGGGPSLGSGGVGPTPTPGPLGDECARQSFIVSSKPADVLLVLDRSKSMIENTVPPNGDSRWDAVVPALTSVISATDSAISWGLKLFPEGEGSQCIAESVTDAIPAPIKPGNAATVNGIIQSTEALGNGTPTGAAIAKATEYLKSRTAGSQYILLATDGDPSCPKGDDAAEEQAISAIADAKAAGFPVYVIGVLDPEEDDGKFPTLNAMAEAGGTALPESPLGTKFFQVNSQDDLKAALLQVTGEVASCEFPFTKRPPNVKNIGVQIGGVWVDQDPNRLEGWEYTSDAYLGIELFGSACQQVKTSAEVSVDIVFGCDDPVR